VVAYANGMLSRVIVREMRHNVMAMIINRIVILHL